MTLNEPGRELQSLKGLQLSTGTLIHWEGKRIHTGERERCEQRLKYRITKTCAADSKADCCG